jgi:hypothetical protein
MCLESRGRGHWGIKDTDRGHRMVSTLFLLPMLFRGCALSFSLFAVSYTDILTVRYIQTYYNRYDMDCVTALEK